MLFVFCIWVILFQNDYLYLSSSDTDSLFFGLSDEMDNLVLPHMQHKWTDIKKKWFCTHDKCKIPGLLKMSIFLLFIFL